jgi:hypothetical protein
VPCRSASTSSRSPPRERRGRKNVCAASERKPHSPDVISRRAQENVRRRDFPYFDRCSRLSVDPTLRRYGHKIQTPAQASDRCYRGQSRSVLGAATAERELTSAGWDPRGVDVVGSAWHGQPMADPSLRMIFVEAPATAIGRALPPPARAC